jgi:hypothetical protein
LTVFIAEYTVTRNGTQGKQPYYFDYPVISNDKKILQKPCDQHTVDEWRLLRQSTEIQEAVMNGIDEKLNGNDSSSPLGLGYSGNLLYQSFY